MSFSPDGRLFACGTTGPDIYLWEESPTGYTLHQKFISSTLSPIPLFSPDGTSVFTRGPTAIQLWPSGGPSNLASHSSLRTAGRSEHFLLDFLPDKGLAAFARGRSRTAKVLDLERGIQRLTVHTDTEIYGLRVTENTVVVEEWDRFVVWKLPVGEDAVARPEDCVMTKPSEFQRLSRPQSASFSPDCLWTAVRGTVGDMGVRSLSIHDVSTGTLLAWTFAAGDMAWFSRNGSQVWCDGEVGKEQGWQVLTGNATAEVRLNPLPIGNPPEGYPWQSSRGCTVTDDWWVLDPQGKRLLWLPPCWRSHDRRTRVWSGPYLVLLHNSLPRPVILKLGA